MVRKPTVLIEKDEHGALVDFLARKSGEIWTSSVVEVARHIKKTRDTLNPG